MPTCLLVRHGRTAANAAGVLAGWTPGVALDDRGREQVDELAARLAEIPVVALVSSPLERCAETTERLVAGAGWDGVPSSVEADLGECRYGAWTGRPLSELAKEPLWPVVQDHPSAMVFPSGDDYPGEAMADMAHRAVSAIRRWDAAVLAEHGPHAVWVAVSHGDVIKAIVADACGTPLDLFQRYHVGPASLTAISYTPKRPFLMRLNDTGAEVASLVPKPPPSQTAGGADEAGGTAQGAGGASGGRGPGADPSGDAALGGGTRD